jgi:hypothetical protein
MSGVLNLRPSPLWGRGWTVTGAFIRRGGTGEGVKAERAGLILAPVFWHNIHNAPFRNRSAAQR